MRKTVWICGLIALLTLTGCSEKSKDNPEEQDAQVKREEVEQKKNEPIDFNLKLSDKLSDFQFAINDRIYQLPLRMEEMIQRNWTYDGDHSKLIAAESFLEGEKLKKDEESVTIDFVNLEMDTQPILNCYMGGITFRKEDNQTYQVELPNHIVMGYSTLDEVLDAYGKPEDQYEEKDRIYLTYEYGIYKNATLAFDLQEELLQGIDLNNYRVPEEEQTISKEVPEVVKQYIAPEVMSNDIQDITVEYGGAYYRLPAPVSEFLKNGWEISDEGSDSSVKSGRHGYVTLEKDGKSVYAVVNNYSDTVVRIENCFVTGVHGDFDITKVPIKVYKGISLGMEESNVTGLLEGVAYVKEEEDQFNHYIYYIDSEKIDSIKISIDKELGMVREISVNNSPGTINNRTDLDGDESDSTAMYMQESLPQDEAPVNPDPSNDLPVEEQ